MQPVRRMLTVSMGVAGMMLLPVFPIFAESIYHWKDRNGASCYSNTNVPSGEAEFSILSAVRSGTEEAESPSPADTAGQGDGQTPAVDASGVVSDSMAAVLRNRIENRHASIHSIEALLRAHPDDASLRRRLHEKRQSLNEDMIRLKLLEE